MSVVSPDARSSDSEFFSRDATSSWDVYNGPGIGHLWIFFCRKKQNSERLIKARESKLPRMKEITSLLIKRIVVVSQGPSLSPAPSREGRPPPSPRLPYPSLGFVKQQSTHLQMSASCIREALESAKSVRGHGVLGISDVVWPMQNHLPKRWASIGSTIRGRGLNEPIKNKYYIYLYPENQNQNRNCNPIGKKPRLRKIWF